MEFLIMSYKCDKIFGTPGSSFSIQASLFGGTDYSEINTTPFQINGHRA